MADDVVLGSTDEVSWFHLGATERDAIENIILTIPKITGQNGVIICPGAISAEEIAETCE